MRVAFVYNAKPTARKEIAAVRPSTVVTEEEEEPPSPEGVGSEDDLWAEWDDSRTILGVADALASRHEVELIEARGDFARRLRLYRPDLVFNIAEGLHGVSREAQVPAILEMLDIPYSGSDPLTLALCLDKAWTKVMLAHEGVPTARFAVVGSEAELGRTDHLALPVMVKPLYEGSSKGIRDDHLVREDRGRLAQIVRRTLETYRQPVLVEEFLPGREFTVGFIGNGDDLLILPPVEIRFDSLPPGANPIYSWEAKWVWDQHDAPLQVFDCPARLSPAELAQIEDTCRRTIRALRLRDWSRIDLRADSRGIPNVIEVNPLPGILPDPADNSCFPKAARAAGISYDEALLRVVDAAWRRIAGGRR